MPAKTKRQQRFMGAELARRRSGKKTKTGMSEQQLREFVSKKENNMPRRRKSKGSRTKEGYSRAAETAKAAKAAVTDDVGVSSASKRGGHGKALAKAAKGATPRGRRMMKVMRGKY